MFYDQLPKFTNFTFVEGIAGSGKTGAVFRIIDAYLNQYHPDLKKNSWAVHTDEKKAEDNLVKNGIGTKSFSHK
jgi:hypothetical protein